MTSLIILDGATSFLFFFQAEDGIRDLTVTGVQTCALPISERDDPTPGRSTTAAPRGVTRQIATWMRRRALQRRACRAEHGAPRLKACSFLHFLGVDTSLTAQAYFSHEKEESSRSRARPTRRTKGRSSTSSEAERRRAPRDRQTGRRGPVGSRQN